MAKFALNVNGARATVDVRDPAEPLLFVLRNQLGLTGAKYGCGLGQCGACTVLIDGEATRSCTVAGERSAAARRSRRSRVSGPRPSRIRCRPRVRRRAGGAVRLLRDGHGDDRGGAARDTNPRPTRDGRAAGARRQPVPLRHAPAHPRRGRARGGGEGMNAPSTPRFPEGRRRARRRLLARAAAPRRSSSPAAEKALGKTLDVNDVDGFLAVNADGQRDDLLRQGGPRAGAAHRDPADGRRGARLRGRVASRWSRATPRSRPTRARPRAAPASCAAACRSGRPRRPRARR